MAEREWLRQIVDGLQVKLQGGARVDRREFYHLCILLSKAMDCTIAVNQSPHCVHDLIQVLKQVCTQREDLEVRPAILGLMLSFKCAVQIGWFNNVEFGDLLCIVNELLNLYDSLGSASVKTPPDFASIEKVTADVLLRLYPWLELGSILLYIDAEAGYRTLISEFYIRAPGPVKLFTIRRGAVELPSCLAPPTSVSFILNGRPVDKRTPLHMDSGPQPPAECTRYCRLGNNVLQVVGEFPASYAIVVAQTKPAMFKPTLLDLPETQLLADDDLTEGASRVSLCCPISRQRIATPVKGLACKHLQCFDFKNYTEMNIKRPSWRCPYCTVVVTLQDLRIDRKMEKILREVDGSIKDVMLTSNGSWQVLESHSMESRTKKSAPNVIDLSEIDNEDVPTSSPSSRPKESTSTPLQLPSSSILLSSAALTEDRKPDITSLSRANLSPVGLAPSRSLPGNYLPSTPSGPELRQHQRSTPTNRLRLQHSDARRLYQQLVAVADTRAQQAQALGQAQLQQAGQQVHRHAQLRQAHPQQSLQTQQQASLLQQTQQAQVLAQAQQQAQGQQQQAQPWQQMLHSFSRQQGIAQQQQQQQQQAQLLYAQQPHLSHRAPAQQSQPIQAASQQQHQAAPAPQQQQSQQFQLQSPPVAGRRQIHPWSVIPGSSNDQPQ